MYRRKFESAALFAVIFGAMLITPPLVLLLNTRMRFLGLPTEGIYLFVVWLLLILVAAAFAHRMPHDAASDEKPEDHG